MRQKITILLPVYNEEESMGLLRECMDRVLRDNPDYDWEFLLVNDGSEDHSLQQMMRLHNEDPEHYSYLDLSRNYGKEIAMMAGMDYVDSDALIIMDSDMQHPVDVIPQMIQYWREGYDDVYAQRATSPEGWFKRHTSRLYYRILQSMTRVQVQKDTGDFRLLDRSCVQALKAMREVDRNTKGLYSWIGYRKKGIQYHQRERAAGQTKWGFLSLLNLAINGITSYSTTPLRVSTLLGLLVSFMAFAYLIFIVVRTIFYGEPVTGFPTIMVTILFLGGVQLISIGIIGEYLATVFHESKRRPGYFARTYNGRKL